jgi:hypothetical protein
LVGDEEGAEGLGVGVDEEGELGKDGQPDVVGPELEVQVLLPGADDGVGEAILGRGNAATTVWEGEGGAENRVFAVAVGDGSEQLGWGGFKPVAALAAPLD